MSRPAQIIICIVAAIAIPTSCAVAIGFRLGQSKESLNLKYELSVYDHDTGRVTVTFSLEDAGRLKPVSSIDLHIPSEEMHDGGGRKSDLTMSMATRKEGTKQVARIHIRKDWAERAEIHIKTGHLDGKQQMMTWYFHAIPLKALVDRAEKHKTIN